LFFPNGVFNSIQGSRVTLGSYACSLFAMQPFQIRLVVI
jgi:hypothetical protein